MDKILKFLKCDHSNKSYGALLSWVLFIMLFKVAPAFESGDELLKREHV